jgi:surfactin synthase thioesterase subunit
MADASLPGEIGRRQTTTGATMPPARSPWFLRLSARPQPAMRLLAFPYAGAGAAMFRRWVDRLPSTVDVVGVQLPGRQNRSREAPARDLANLVRTIAAEMRTTFSDGAPLVLFGHSLGAVIAFELARHLRRSDGTLPLALVVSGRTPPHLTSGPPRHGMSDEELIGDLRRLDGIPPEIEGNREFLTLALPSLRADLFLDESYVYVNEPPLDCPILALGGDADPEVSSDDLKAWAIHTRSAFAIRIFEGGHFFPQTRPELFLPALAGFLDSLTTYR